MISPRSSAVRWNFRMISMLLLPMVCAVASRADEAFSMEEILAVSYPTEIATASQADRVVWVLNDRGARNLWTASGAEAGPRRLTAYEGDDGQPIAHKAGSTLVHRPSLGGLPPMGTHRP